MQKAGLSDLADLRAATLEQLMAVPGMSEIKARHIQNYLSQYPEAVFKREKRSEIASSAEHRSTRSGHRKEAPTDVVQFMIGQSAALPASWSPLAADGQQALVLVLTLLMSDPATGYRGRLLREMARFLNRMRAVLETSSLSARGETRALRRLHALLTVLAAAVEQPDLDRKSQARLAETLSEVNDRLVALNGKDRLSDAEEADD